MWMEKCQSIKTMSIDNLNNLLIILVVIEYINENTQGGV